MNNDRLGCSLIHKIDIGIDTGDILKIKKFRFPLSCIVPEDYEKYQTEKDKIFLTEFINDIKSNNAFNLLVQDENCSEYWPRLDTLTHGYVNWSWDLDSILFFINAFDSPYQGASTFLNGNRVHLRNCKITKGKVFHPFQTGLIYKKSKSELFVSTKEGTLIIKEINSAEGQNIIKKIKIGDRLYTSTEHLDKSLATKIVYTSEGKKSSNN